MHTTFRSVSAVGDLPSLSRSRAQPGREAPRRSALDVIVLVFVALFATIFLVRAEANPTSRAGAMLTQADSSLLTLQAPTVEIAALPGTLTVGGQSVIMITLTNPNIGVFDEITGLQLTINYPMPLHIENAQGGAVIADPCDPTILAVGGQTSVLMQNGTIPPGGSCTFGIEVVGTSAGTSDVHTGPATSTNASPGADASASVTVMDGTLLAAPTVEMALSPVSITVGGTSQMTIKVTNNDANSDVTGLQLDSIYVFGMSNAPSGALVRNTCGGLLTLRPDGGDAQLQLINGTIPAGDSCSMVVNVIGSAPSFPHPSTDPLITANAQGGGFASATMVVTNGLLVGQPTATKQFAPTTVAVGETSQMTITLSNPNGVAITGAQFTDNYPDGMTNAPTPNDVVASNTCGGVVSADPSGKWTALSNGTIPAGGPSGGTCAVVINVIGTKEGQWFNQTGAIPSGNASTGGAALAGLSVQGSATLVTAPTVSKAFNPQNVTVGNTSKMTITLTNNDANVAVTNAQFTDPYPGGIANASSAVIDSNTCGGTVTAPQNGLSTALSNGTIPAGGMCSVVINVVATAPGTSENHTGPVNSANADPGADASATLTVGAGTLLSPPTVSKGFATSTIAVGDSVWMTITLTNHNNTAITGVKFTDNYPTPIHMTNAPSGVVVSNTCGGSVTADNNGLSVALVNGTIPASNSCSVIIKVIGTSAGSLLNDSGAVTSVNANPGIAATATLTVNGGASNAADVTLSKSHAGNFSQAQTGAVYSLIAHNIGSVATSGTVTVTDSLPPSLTVTDMSGPGWNCTPATLSCTRSDPLAAGASYPSITLTVDVAASAPSSVTNTANVSGGGETDVSNDSASDPTTVDSASLGPDMTLTKNHAGNFSQGQTGAVYSLIAHNVGGGATTGTVTVADTLPPSMTPTAMSGPGWTCSPATVSCTRSDALAAGSSYSAITLTVNVAASAPPSATNVASASGGGETNVNNDPANDPTSIDGSSAGPDLTLTKSHSGDFSQGQTGAIYTLTAHNVGGAATSGVVTVTDTLPSSLAATQMSGNGWTCPPGTTSCTRSDPLPSGASYPDITLQVDVAASAPPIVTNVASVSGGAETNINNDPANDPTSIAGVVVGPDLTLTKSHVGDFTEGQVGATYTLTVHNGGGAATSGVVTVTDTLPPSLTATSMSGNGWTCQPGTTTCTRSNALAGGASYADIIMVVNVAPNAPASATNNASVSGGGETNTANDSASDLTTIQSNGGNHAPVAVGDAAQVTPNGTTGDIVGDAKVVDSLLDNDVDADAPVGDTLKAIKVSDPIHGTLLQFNADGTFVYKNTSSASSDVFTYKACDSHNTCSAETKVTVTIGNALNNHLPFATDDAIEVVPGNSAVDLVGDPNVADSMLDNDIDFDGDTLTATKLTDPSHGNLVQFNVDGTFKYQNTSSASTDSFLYQACDSFGACDLGVVTITIGNGLMDSPPVVVDDAIQVTPNPPGNTSNTLVGDLNIPSSVLDNDSDPDLADVLTATKMSGLLNASGTLTFNADGTFSYQNTDPSVSTDSFFYEACDESMACMPGIVSITVTNNPPDSPPIAMNDAILVGGNGTANTLVGDPNVPNSVLDNDSDPDSGDTLRRTSSRRH